MAIAGPEGFRETAAQAVGIAIMGNATNYPIDAIARLALTRT